MLRPFIGIADSRRAAHQEFAGRHIDHCRAVCLAHLRRPGGWLGVRSSRHIKHQTGYRGEHDRHSHEFPCLCVHTIISCVKLLSIFFHRFCIYTRGVAHFSCLRYFAFTALLYAGHIHARDIALLHRAERADATARDITPHEPSTCSFFRRFQMSIEELPQRTPFRKID